MEAVYVIHTRECISINKPIYKFGRSFNVSNRVKQYPQNSNVEFIMSCTDSVFCEREILKILKNKFIQATLYGSEYFEGDKHLIIETIFNFINGKYNVVKNNNDNNDKKDIPKKAEISKTDNVKKNNKKDVNKPTIRLPVKKEKKELKDDNINNEETLDDNKCVKCVKCVKCEQTFKYPSYYKRHITTSVRCKNEEDKIVNEIITSEITTNELTDNDIFNSDLIVNEIADNELRGNEIADNELTVNDITTSEITVKDIINNSELTVNDIINTVNNDQLELNTNSSEINCKKNAFYSLTNKEEIEEYINITNQNKNNFIKCNLCQITFSCNSGLNRHNLDSKCGKIQTAILAKNKNGINKLTIEQYKLLFPDKIINFVF